MSALDAPDVAGTPLISRSGICRTVQEAFQAGWDDAADAPPLSQEQVDRFHALITAARKAAAA